jgi:antitoxin component YwqK of YwqJK toxin-antitoxin module
MKFEKVSLDFEDIYVDSGFPLMLSVSQSLNMISEELIFSSDSEVSDKQRFIYAAINVYSQVCNGGFIQYFYNGYGKQFPYFCEGIIKYSCPEIVIEIFKKVNSIFEEKVKNFDRKGLDPFSEILNLYHEDDPRMKELNDLDFNFYKIEKEFFRFFDKFIRLNYSEFTTIKGKVFINEGINETYYDNGILKERFKIENGLIIDKFECFFNNGNLNKRVFYGSDGNGLDSYEYYFENGSRKEFKVKDLNDNSYLMQFFHDNDQLSLEYDLGQNPFTILNGWTKEGENILRNGTGVYIREYELFEVKYRDEYDYLNYKRHGKQFSFRNGVLTLYQEMVDGKCHGKTISYDKGVPIRETLYEHDKEVKKTDLR